MAAFRSLPGLGILDAWTQARNPCRHGPSGSR